MKKILVSIIILGLLSLNSIVTINAYELENNIEIFYNNTYYNQPYEGYTLFAPEYSKYTYLINNSGEIVHIWKSEHIQALGVHLLENGSLLRTCGTNRIDEFFFLGGRSGRIEMFDWNGTLIWEFEHVGSTYCMHHDFKLLPNGNILAIIWEKKNVSEAIDAGCNPNTVPTFHKLFGKWIGNFYTTYIIEIDPIYPSGGNIVWEWHAWDHMIQDYDASKDNYGIVADHPELLDINYRDEKVKQSGTDVLHINSIDYNETFDQILLGVRALDEIWIIDHSTTTVEAAGHTGGNSGKGGDILYRWGNPQVYRTGDKSDQKLFKQHSAQWVKSDCPGGGHITIFNNGHGRPDGEYSSIEEIVLPVVDTNGNYYLEPGSAYGPDQPVWEYKADNPTDFYSEELSSAQRLPNGNTLICEGKKGHFFEINHGKQIVWEYTNPYPFPFINDVFKIQRYPLDYPGIGTLSADIDSESLEMEYDAFTVTTSMYNESIEQSQSTLSSTQTSLTNN